MGGNGVRGSNITRGGAPQSRGQAAAQAGPNAPKKTMEQLLAGIMAASGLPGTPSPPQPKNDYPTANHRFIVTEYVDIARFGR